MRRDAHHILVVALASSLVGCSSVQTPNETLVELPVPDYRSVPIQRQGLISIVPFSDERSKAQRMNCRIGESVGSGADHKSEIVYFRLADGFDLGRTLTEFFAEGLSRAGYDIRIASLPPPTADAHPDSVATLFLSGRIRVFSVHISEESTFSTVIEVYLKNPAQQELLWQETYRTVIATKTTDIQDRLHLLAADGSRVSPNDAGKFQWSDVRWLEFCGEKIPMDGHTKEIDKDIWLWIIESGVFHQMLMEGNWHCSGLSDLVQQGTNEIMNQAVTDFASEAFSNFSRLAQPIDLR